MRSTVHPRKANPMSSDQSVPKPSRMLDATPATNCELSTFTTGELKGGVSGKPDPLAVAEACKRAQDAGVAIVGDLGAVLAHGDRRKILTAFRRILFPPRRAGRRPKETVAALTGIGRMGCAVPRCIALTFPDGTSTTGTGDRVRRGHSWMPYTRGKDAQGSEQEGYRHNCPEGPGHSSRYAICFPGNRSSGLPRSEVSARLSLPPSSV